MKNLTDKFVVRFPKGMRDRIAEAAKFYRRSMNSEILMRLEHSLNTLPNIQTETAIQPPFFSAIEGVLRKDLSEEEQTLIHNFRRLPAHKRKSLFELLSWDRIT